MSDPAALYSRWLKPGDLVFDIGAHVGLRTAVFLAMGCRVVAVEPQAWEAAHIDRRATVLDSMAVSDHSGVATFHVCDAQTYLSSLEDDYPGQYPDTVWRDITVHTVTLDELVEEFGVPAFVKIDVEGGEVAVLNGLTYPLAALSFEVHSFNLAKAGRCLDRLQALGRYELLYSRREGFDLEPWPPESPDLFGDVYATRIDTREGVMPV